MKNTFGAALTITLFGESHGPAIGAVIDGLSPGIKIDMDYVNAKLSQRKAVGKISTGRQEADEVEILSGVFEGRTSGTPLTLLIRNADTRSKDYSRMRYLARPSHADYTAEIKYGGYQDYRGGGHFSGRITAPIVAAGAIVMRALEEKGIYIGTHIKSCHGICDREFGEFYYEKPAGVTAEKVNGSTDKEEDRTNEAKKDTGKLKISTEEVKTCAENAKNTAAAEKYASSLEEDLKYLGQAAFPVLDTAAAQAMRAEIEKAAADGDSVGGILETAVCGIPAGVGEPWFDTVESVLSHGIFAIPAVKGIEFGAGFALAGMLGSEANDPFRWAKDRAVTATNNNGGINGGITNGMPIVFRTAIKPTPSIYKKQDTVDFHAGENCELVIEGRHDPAIIHRARVVVDAVTALVLGDMLTLRYGTDFLAKERCL